MGGVPSSTAAAAAAAAAAPAARPMRLSNQLRAAAGLPPILRPEEQGDRAVYTTAAVAAAAAAGRGGRRARRDTDVPSAFCDNSVVTAKYSLLTFVPVFLLENFSRFANAYFLMVCGARALRERRRVIGGKKRDAGRC